MESRVHYPWLDGIRCIAILLVILTHATENIYVLNDTLVNEPTWYMAVFFHSLGRIGVPFFLFLTGFLLLDRSYDEVQVIQFIRKRWLGIVIATASWILLYDIFLRFYLHQHTNIGLVVKEILMVRNVNMPHMWYMPMIIGIYLFVPFMANALHTVKRVQVLYVPVAIVSVYAFVVPMINEMYRVLGKPLLTHGIDVGFSGGVYGLYLIGGFLVKRKFLQRISSIYVILIAVLAFVGTLALQGWTIQHGKVLDPWYTWGTVLLCALCLFELLSRVRQQVWNYDWIALVAHYSFAMYLTHYPLMMVLKPWVQAIDVSQPIAVIILWGLSCMVSLVVSIGIRRSPKVGNVIIYMR